jgi:hypothetical protein
LSDVEEHRVENENRPGRAGAALVVAAGLTALTAGSAAAGSAQNGVRHVLLISVDGLNVPIVVAGASAVDTENGGLLVNRPVETTQIAPTILRLLGLNPAALPAVRIEHTAVLPGVEEGR